MSTIDVCIFCFATRAETKRPGEMEFFWVPGVMHPNDGCTYGLRHEFPAEPSPPVAPAVKKRDAKLCIHCGLHARNPASQTNGCRHSYGDGA